MAHGACGRANSGGATYKVKVSLQVSDFSSPHFSVKLRAWHRRLRKKDRRVLFRCAPQRWAQRLDAAQRA